MDGSRFDELARSVANSSRRQLLARFAGLAGGGVFGVLRGTAVGAATCREVGRTCREHANCCSGNCGPKDATGRSRCACSKFCEGTCCQTPKAVCAGFLGNDCCESGKTCGQNCCAGSGDTCCGLGQSAQACCPVGTTCADPTTETCCASGKSCEGVCCQSPGAVCNPYDGHCCNSGIVCDGTFCCPNATDTCCVRDLPGGGHSVACCAQGQICTDEGSCCASGKSCPGDGAGPVCCALSTDVCNTFGTCSACRVQGRSCDDVPCCVGLTCTQPEELCCATGKSCPGDGSGPVCCALSTDVCNTFGTCSACRTEGRSCDDVPCCAGLTCDANDVCV